MMTRSPHKRSSCAVPGGPRLSALLAVAAVTGLGGATLSTATLSAAADASTLAGGSSARNGAVQAGSAAVVPIVLQRDDTKGPAGTITGKPGWPRYSPSAISVPAGKEVTLLIVNFDDMSAPLSSALESYDKPQGGAETVNGHAVKSVSNKMVAHTFTVPELGINVVLPKASDEGTGKDKTVVPAVVTFTFTATKAGTFTFKCFTPCGTGKTGTAGPMAEMGWMQGTLTVTSGQ